MIRPRTRPVRRVTAACLRLALAVSLAASLSACSGDEKKKSDKEDAPSAKASSVRTNARIGKVRGKLAAPARKQLVEQVGATVDGWVEAAYLGEYPRPRSAFADAFPGFTPGAVRRARADLNLMSNAGVSEQIDSSTAVRRFVRVDTLAAEGRPATATARFQMVFRLTGDVDRRVRVSGSLYLTNDRGWKVFGYSVNRGIE